jgi:hypothetical protein
MQLGRRIRRAQPFGAIITRLFLAGRLIPDASSARLRSGREPTGEESSLLPLEVVSALVAVIWGLEDAGLT